MAAATITMESTRRAMVHTADRSGATASLKRSRQTPTESQTSHNHTTIYVYRYIFSIDIFFQYINCEKYDLNMYIYIISNYIHIFIIIHLKTCIYAFKCIYVFKYKYVYIIIYLYLFFLKIYKDSIYINI